MIQLNYRDSRPIFEQVKDGFRGLIISGVLAEGEKMPSVRDLASSLAINPNTIQRAYRKLESEGYIVSVPGRGSYVSRRDEAAERRKRELKEQMVLLLKELHQTGASVHELQELIKGEYEHD